MYNSLKLEKISHYFSLILRQQKSGYEGSLVIVGTREHEILDASFGHLQHFLFINLC